MYAIRSYYDHFGAFVQRRAVAQRLLGGGVGLVLGDVGEFEQLVGGGDDVLDLGTGLCLSYNFV